MIRQCRAYLEIDLAAIAHNYRRLCATYQGQVAAVVKRNAYQLGLKPVVQVLLDHGCSSFFAEDFSEALTLRQIAGPGVEIHALAGFSGASPQEMHAAAIFPVLSAPEELALAAQVAGLRVTLNFETGLGRGGLGGEDLARLPAGVQVAHVMSHLALMQDPDAAQNHAQKAAFLAFAAQFPHAGRSLASSAFALEGENWRVGMARAGSAIFGTRHVERPAYQVQPAVGLYAPIGQILDIRAGQPIGYGRHLVQRDSRIGILRLGYADGLPERFWHSHPHVYVAGQPCALLPEISMMQSFVDLTDLPAGAYPLAEVFGKNICINGFAAALGLKPNVVMTHLGAMLPRFYLNGSGDI